MKFKQNPQLYLGVFITAAVILTAIFAPLLAPYDPIDDANLLNSLEQPGDQFIFGTDRQGRDIFSRIIYGARISLTIGLVTQIINTFVGVLMGLIAGYFGGKIDDLIMNITNLMLSIPSLILALAIMAVLGPGLINIFIALGFTLWTYTCRVTRAQTLAIKEKEFISAARALGASNKRIIFKHILPNIIGPVLVIATFGVASAILIESSLSFLGIGAQPPTPSWGTMLSNGKDYIWTAPWIMIYPGIAIVLTILGLNLMGDGIRDYLDPHKKG
ncbi:ABC transporter permease subunit [Halanaerobium salsuginis]